LKKSLLIIIISLVVSMVSMVGVSSVHGQIYTTLYVSPPSIIDTTKTAGTTFTINVNIKNATDLYGFEFFLNYTTTVLTVTDVTLGPFFEDAFTWRDDRNDTLGYIRYAATLPLGTPTGGGLNGSGTLLIVTLTVDSIGESILDLWNTKPNNSWGERIAHTVYDGYFSNIVRHTKLYVDPEDTIDPDLTAGENFTINVNILNATDLYGFEFFLNYTTTVLTATNVTLGPFFPEDSRIVHEEINDTLGYVWYNVTMPLGSPVGETGDGILANVTFTVDSIGESRLDLCNTKLVDSEGDRIEHNTMDGSFSNELMTHDIAITDIRTTVTTVEETDIGTILVPEDVSEVHAGEKLNVTVYVKNNGTSTETFNVTAYYDDNIIGTENVTLLEGGFSKTVTIEWNTGGVAVGNYTIRAETSDVEGDINPDNNRFTMEDEFSVLWTQTFPIELVAAAGGIVLIVAAVAVYFLKFRRPKSVAEGTLSESKG